MLVAFCTTKCLEVKCNLDKTMLTIKVCSDFKVYLYVL